MIPDVLKQRLTKDRVMTTVTVRMPVERFAVWADEWFRIDAQVRRAHE